MKDVCAVMDMRFVLIDDIAASVIAVLISLVEITLIISKIKKPASRGSRLFEDRPHVEDSRRKKDDQRGNQEDRQGRRQDS